VKISVLGAGAWGTALAQVLCDGKNEVALWGHDSNRLAELAKSRRNEPYLPGVELSPALRFEPDLQRAVAKPDLVLMAVPSRAFREISARLCGYSGIVVSATKGIEPVTGFTMCDILAQIAPQARLAALSGPTLAFEVARGVPTAITAASRDETTAALVQRLFHRPHFRVYTSTDLQGVELGGALKNVIAIAAGVCDGLGFGDNSKAALVTRGLTEIRRLGVAAGAQADTFFGLSGLGDLMVTCFSKLSRNRGFGECLGRGEKVEAILAGAKSVVEGHPTARSAYELAGKLRIETPIIAEIYAALYQSKNPAHALRDLTARESKAE
jgi:glycerol-3-phosphate dehydrogenase (NAD(P)+)